MVGEMLAEEIGEETVTEMKTRNASTDQYLDWTNAAVADHAEKLLKEYAGAQHLGREVARRLRKLDQLEQIVCGNPRDDVGFDGPYPEDWINQTAYELRKWVENGCEEVPQDLVRRLFGSLMQVSVPEVVSEPPNPSWGPPGLKSAWFNELEFMYIASAINWLVGFHSGAAPHGSRLADAIEQPLALFMSKFGGHLERDDGTRVEA